LRLSAAIGAGAFAAVVAMSAAAARGQVPFATRVLEYAPAPGQFVNHAAYNDPARALGAPVGGGLSAADNSKVVTLGGFGGRITLGFASPIVDHPPTSANPSGADFIVYGNAFFVGGVPGRRFAEAAVVEVSADTNGNGEADDAWYVVRGSHLPGVPAGTVVARTYDAAALDPAWVPPGRSGVWTVSGYRLPALFDAAVVVNPLGVSSPTEGTFGYADCSPTLLLGDTDADGLVDDAGMAPEVFYTRPDDPALSGVSPGSGGGDAVDLAWAVDPATGAPAGLAAVDFVRITTAIDREHALFGEGSAEVSAVAMVRAGGGGHPADFDGNGVLNPDDLADFIAAYFGGEARADFDGSGVLNPDDLADFIVAYFS
jgi:hypothetical protein